MTFQEWWKENSVDLDDDYSKMDMEWIAELSWKAGVNEGRRMAANKAIQQLINK